MNLEQAMEVAHGYFEPYLEKGAHFYAIRPDGKFEEGLLDEVHIVRVSLQFDADGSPRPPHFHASIFLAGWPGNAYSACRLVKVLEVADGDYGTRRFTLDNGESIELAPPADEDIEAAVARARKYQAGLEGVDSHRQYVLAQHRDWANAWESRPK